MFKMYYNILKFSHVACSLKRRSRVKVKRDSAIPLYQQIARALRQQIETGELKPGATLPPESELTKKFRVSRITARKALDLIASEGLIVRKQGKGTFINPPKIQQDLSSLQGFAELMAARGPDQEMQVIAFDVIPADDSVARSLQLSAGQNVLRIQRRHCWKNTPIAYAVIYLPHQLGKLLTLPQVSTTPIYTLLTEKAHLEIKRANQVIRAIAADQDTAQWLDWNLGSPVMMVERITYSTEEIPVEYILFFYRGDSYELAVELRRDPARNILTPVNNLERLVVAS
jgi:GntR family transcriptional regulator